MKKCIFYKFFIKNNSNNKLNIILFIIIMNKYIEFIEYNMKTFKYSYSYLQSNGNMTEIII